MDNWNSQKPSVPRMARILFYILIAVICVAITSLFTFNINEVAKAENGEIIAKNSPMQFIAPYDVSQHRLHVKEGDYVRKDDTLGAVYNSKLLQDYQERMNEQYIAKKNVELYEELTKSLKRKVRYLRRGKSHLKDKYGTNFRSSRLEQEGLALQAFTIQQDLMIAKKAFITDSLLYKDRVISRKQYAATHTQYLNAKRRVQDLSHRHNKEDLTIDKLEDSYQSEKNMQSLKVLDAEQEYLKAKKTLIQYETEVVNLETKINFLEDGLSRQYIIAEIDGHVRFVYNAKAEKNLIKSGEVVLTIVPEKDEQFYAKLDLPQNSIKDVRVGLPVHLKVDAYNSLQYGVVKGRVSYISNTEQNQFYALVRITEKRDDLVLKNGFSTKGDIILNKVKLYQYLINSLLRNNDQPKKDKKKDNDQKVATQ